MHFNASSSNNRQYTEIKNKTKEEESKNIGQFKTQRCTDSKDRDADFRIIIKSEAPIH